MKVFFLHSIEWFDEWKAIQVTFLQSTHAHRAKERERLRERGWENVKEKTREKKWCAQQGEVHNIKELCHIIKWILFVYLQFCLIECLFGCFVFNVFDHEHARSMKERKKNDQNGQHQWQWGHAKPHSINMFFFYTITNSLIDSMFLSSASTRKIISQLSLPSSDSNQSIKSNNISQVNHCHNTCTYDTDVISSIGKSSIISGLIKHIVATHSAINEQKKKYRRK